MTNHRPRPRRPRPRACAWKALSLLLSNQAASAANHRPAGVCLTMWDVKERTVAVAAGGGRGGSGLGCEQRDLHVSLSHQRSQHPFLLSAHV